MLKFAAVLALLASPLGAQQTLIEEGFNHFYNLDYDQAIAAFERAIAHNPASPDLHNHLAQTLIFREMFRNGALESELVSGSNSFNWFQIPFAIAGTACSVAWPISSTYTESVSSWNRLD